MTKIILVTLILSIILNINACRGKDITQRDITSNEESGSIVDSEEHDTETSRHASATERESIITSEEQVTESADLYGTIFDDLTYMLGDKQTTVHYPSNAGLVEPIYDGVNSIVFTDEHTSYYVTVQKNYGDALDTLSDSVLTTMLMVFNTMSFDETVNKTCMDFGAELEELDVNGKTVYKITYEGQENEDGYKPHLVGYSFNFKSNDDFDNITVVGYTKRSKFEQYTSDLVDYLINNIEITE